MSLSLAQQREAAARAAHLSPRDVDVRELWGRQPDGLCEGQEASEQRGAVLAGEQGALTRLCIMNNLCMLPAYVVVFSSAVPITSPSRSLRSLDHRLRTLPELGQRVGLGGAEES